MDYASDIGAWVFCVLKKWHGWLGGSALMGVVGFLQALKIWEHPTVKVYVGLLCAGFVVSFFEAWRDEYKVRLQVGDANRWDVMEGKFKDCDDRGVSVARWSARVETGDCSWEINCGSIAATKLMTEICREAGAQLLKSKSFVSKFAEIAKVREDGDRWLLALRHVGEFGKPTGMVRTTVKGVERNYENGEINDLRVASQVLCHKARNEFRQ